MDEMFSNNLEEMTKGVKMGKPWSVYFGNARGASTSMSPKIWERFVWPYVVKTVDAIVATGAVVNLHFDSNWDSSVDRFRELPGGGKCVWACDSATDIFKLKKALDGHMCIKGAVPPALLTLGTPDEVYNYCRVNHWALR